MNAELLLDTKCTLGEGPIWEPREQLVYFTDIEQSVLHRYDSASRELSTLPMPERLATYASCADARYLVLGLASRLAFYEIATGKVSTIAEIEAGMATRLNDGRLDREGRFVFGTKDESGEHKTQCAFYRLNADLSVERLPLPLCEISNSLAFSPDGRTMYYCDTPTRTIRVCDYAVDGTIGNNREFVALSDATGSPDGSAIDAQGNLWNSQWGGRRVVCYDPRGRELHRIDVPALQPSCPVFGGADFGTLYLTTARENMSEAQLAAEPTAGGLYRVDMAAAVVHGLPDTPFAGRPANAF
ncbi:SMP-30/gluconolactonase/LRE family protein [Pararobbsia alpina]|uniref:L-arabinolactonase n=1 Tax=Pararobbsia alpina TaxID=621374 RepID=A0A6S7ATL8_9BURK|nr:SMP-30/gluconolactonase/LRE family protein [Pararobbsia alpina]CAB3777365.1 L-arabinolactonase [Pararobbsia alpina]